MFVIARAHPSHAVDCGRRRIRRMWGGGVRLVVRSRSTGTLANACRLCYVL